MDFWSFEIDNYLLWFVMKIFYVDIYILESYEGIFNNMICGY